MELNLFGPRPHQDVGAIERVKRWTVEGFGLAEGTTVMVTELRCTEEGCPDVETVIAVLDGPGKTRQFKVFKPLGEATRADVMALASRPGG
jgi:hypothetical protein